MMRIALCDDEKAHQDKIGAMLAEYPGNDINLKVYSEAEKLLEQIEWGGRDIFDLYILDVIMPGMSGIELGENLRDVGVSAPIIYLTTSKDYAVDSYNVRAFHYLVKPVTTKGITEAFRRRRPSCFPYCRRRRSRSRSRGPTP